MEKRSSERRREELAHLDARDSVASGVRRIWKLRLKVREKVLCFPLPAVRSEVAEACLAGGAGAGAGAVGASVDAGCMVPTSVLCGGC